MSDNNSLFYYDTFKKYLQEIYNANNVTDELTKQFTEFVEQHSYAILEGLLLTRLEKNASGKLGSRSQLISFLTNTKIIRKTLIPNFLLTDTKIALRALFGNIIYDAPTMNEDSIKTNTIFRMNVHFEKFKEESIDYMFYFKLDDETITSYYIDTYTHYTVGQLADIYYRPSVNRQINLDNLPICSSDNFKYDNILDPIAFRNRDRLIHRLINSILEGKRLLSEENILVCYKSQIVHNILKHSAKYQNIINYSPIKKEAEPKSLSELRDDEIKANIIRLLKGSIKQSQYNVFFTKDDYISFIHSKYESLPKGHIQNLFDDTTNPRPPVGVTRFTVNNPIDGQTTYFIALEKVASIFEYSNIKDKQSKQEISALPKSERDFLAFLSKLFKDFDLLGYSDSDKARKLMCSTKTIINMERVISLIY